MTERPVSVLWLNDIKGCQLLASGNQCLLTLMVTLHYHSSTRAWEQALKKNILDGWPKKNVFHWPLTFLKWHSHFVNVNNVNKTSWWFTNVSNCRSIVPTTAKEDLTRCHILFVLSISGWFRQPPWVPDILKNKAVPVLTHKSNHPKLSEKGQSGLAKTDHLRFSPKLLWTAKNCDNWCLPNKTVSKCLCS